MSSQTSAISVDQQPQVTDNPAPSASAPFSPCQGWESLAESSHGVESEQGTLKFIQQVESPLRADSFVFSDDPSEVPKEDEQRRYKPAKPVQVEKSQYTMLPSNISDPPAVMDVACGTFCCGETLCRHGEKTADRCHQ